MLEFVAKAFRGWMTFILVLIIVGFAIFGAVLGSVESGGVAFLLFIVGGIVGLITAILLGGFIANILNMVDNIEKQNKLLKLLLKHHEVAFEEEADESEKNHIKEAGPEYRKDIFYKVIKETALNDSLASAPALKRMLKTEEKVKIMNVIVRNDLGGAWAYVETEQIVDGFKKETAKEVGWCLFSDLNEE